MRAILVIDKPIDCQSCRLVQRDYGNDYWCQFVGELEYDEMTKIHEDCPLKEMPEKRILPSSEVQNTNYGEEPWFSDGWNACLEEIEK